MQQQKSACANCGAELVPEGRFCRKCGEPSNPLERGSVTEVTTRRLETPGQDVTGQQPLEQQSSGQTRAGLSVETQTLAPASTLKRWLPGLVLLCIAILLPAIYVLKKWRQTTIKIVPPTVQVPAVPKPPQPPEAPAKGTTSWASIDQSLIYPGARTTMVVSKAGEGDVVQLETKDAIDKVADWYTAKLKPTEIFRKPDNVILKADEMAVIITSNGSGTNIMLKQGAD
ncbi:MAG TPA: zinc ribbon domain-containing protein [Pyrinomonadaceae bacterium]